MYGPTEDHGRRHLLRSRADDRSGGELPIGRPIAEHSGVRLLDRRGLQPVPVGVRGRALRRRRGGLARGYLGPARR